MSDIEVTLHQPRETPHRCDTPYMGDSRYGIGSIWRCDECGRYWFKARILLPEQRDGGLLGLFAEWEKVGWFNFKIRRRIRDLT